MAPGVDSSASIIATSPSSSWDKLFCAFRQEEKARDQQRASVGKTSRCWPLLLVDAEPAVAPAFFKVSIACVGPPVVVANLFLRDVVDELELSCVEAPKLVDA